MRITSPNPKKAKNAILHIAKQMEDCNSFGCVVLNKILFYADHIHYRDTGKKITGFSYVRQLRGPTPKPSEYMPIKQELFDSHEATEIVRDYFGKPQKRLVAKSLPDHGVFTPEEIANLEKAILMFRGVNGTAASDYSHEHEIGWQLAEQMEVIPPNTFLLIEDDVTEQDIAWGKKAFENFSKTAKRN